MRFWVTGAGGLVGSSLTPALEAAGHEVSRFTRSQGNLTDTAALLAALKPTGAEWVVHLAAYTAVDRCESEAEEAYRVNRDGSRAVAEAAEEVGAACLLLSTDYVFNGNTSRPYTESDGTNPLSVYGKSKLAAEEGVLEVCSRALVVRTSWLFGPGGPNFVGTVLRLAETQDELPVVDDQTGSPTYVPHLAEGLAALATDGARGLYHLAGAGRGTWYDLAREAYRLRGLSPDRVRPVTTDEFPRPAPRPRYSALDCAKVRREHNVTLPPWGEGLKEFLDT